jgi:hypothetical protein
VAPHPFVYEVNTWVWLGELTHREARAVDLGSVPDAEWDAIAALGFDAVWLMGVWERSPAGRARQSGDERSLLVSVIGPRSARAHAGAVLRRRRVPLSARRALGVEAVRAEPVHGARPRVRDDRLRARRVDDGHVRRQLELARAGLAPGQLPADPLARELPPLLRRRAHARVPDGLRHARDLAHRLVAIWLPDAHGRRPVYGGTERLQSDPAWKDNLLFFEHFHGDNGAGLGAMHQTGWTALVADLILDPP